MLSKFFIYRYILIVVCVLALIKPVSAVSQNSPSNKTLTLSLALADVKEISAIGYLPFWRVSLEEDVLELNLATIEAKSFSYESVERTAQGWCIHSKAEDIALKLEIIDENTECSLSRQIYPYRVKLVIKQSGKAESVYTGTGISKGLSPLEPHLSNQNEYLQQVGVTKEHIYSFLDDVKFAVMENDAEKLSDCTAFPLRVNSSKNASFLINSEQDFLKRYKQIFTESAKKKILDIEYDKLYERDGMIGTEQGVFLSVGDNNSIKITIINID